MGKEWDSFNYELGSSEKETPMGRSHSNKSLIGSPTQNTNFQEFNRKWATEALRVLKPGGFMFAMGGTRTHHRLTCGIEDAGFMIRDELCWVYMQGFPKAQSLSDLISKREGAVREGAVREGAGVSTGFVERPAESYKSEYREMTLTENGKQWQGWKTPALKPAFEPIICAQKPCEGSITENVMKFGVGGYNIDECRIPYADKEDASSSSSAFKAFSDKPIGFSGETELVDLERDISEKGRYPSNLLMQEECFGKLSKYFLIAPPTQAKANIYIFSLPNLTLWLHDENFPANYVERNLPIGFLIEKDKQMFFVPNLASLNLGFQSQNPSALSAEKNAECSEISFAQKLVQINTDGTPIYTTISVKKALNTPDTLQKLKKIGEESMQQMAHRKEQGHLPTGDMERSMDGVKSVVWKSDLISTIQIIPSHSKSNYYAINATLNYTNPFILVAKASKGEKEENLEDFEATEIYRKGTGAFGNSNPTCKKCGGEKFPRQLENKDTTCRCAEPDWNIPKNIPSPNYHPTVKPISLMQHLIKLTTKPKYTVLDPFLGSGTTAVAALNLNRNIIGIEISEEYIKIAKARIAEEVKQTRLF